MLKLTLLTLYINIWSNKNAWLGIDWLRGAREFEFYFAQSNGVMFAHGFDHLRNGRFRVREFEEELKQAHSSRHCLATTSRYYGSIYCYEGNGHWPRR